MGEDGENNLIYGLELQGRSLAALAGDPDNISFVVGTQSLKSDNMLYVLTLDEDSGQLQKKVYKHGKGEVWALDTSPNDPSLLITTYGEITSNSWCKKAAVWKIPSTDGSSPDNSPGDLSSISPSSLPTLELQSDLSSVITGAGNSEVNGGWFQPDNPSRVALVQGDRLALVDINSSSGNTKIWESQHSVRGQTRIETGRWNPHRNYHQFSTVCGSQMILWDARTGEKSSAFTQSSGSSVRSVDFNPNKQYYVCCGGDDGSVSIWDTRNTEKPLSWRREHSHWVWSTRYNVFHDQLILSSGSDSRVLLVSEASHSSEPYSHTLDDEDADDKQEPIIEDGLIQTFCDHEDSVYMAEWSVADPWVFASLSYDGRLVISHVPRSVKYKILNLAS